MAMEQPPATLLQEAVVHNESAKLDGGHTHRIGFEKAAVLHAVQLQVVGKRYGSEIKRHFVHQKYTIGVRIFKKTADLRMKGLFDCFHQCELQEGLLRKMRIGKLWSTD